MNRLILCLCVLVIGIGGCAGGPRVYPLVEVPGVFYVNHENSRQEGYNVACRDIWQDGQLRKSDCSGGPSIGQSVVSGSAAAAVGSALLRPDRYKGDNISLDASSSGKGDKPKHGKPSDKGKGDKPKNKDRLWMERTTESFYPSGKLKGSIKKKNYQPVVEY